jgi:hypothetical protein
MNEEILGRTKYMEYSRLAWNHSSPSEPIAIMSEYDDNGWERRKIEVFADGSIGYASARESVGGSELSLIQRPPDADVVHETEFRILELTKSEFEAAWRHAHRSFAGAEA